MLTELKVMKAPEAAMYLRLQLGPMVSWETYLADLRRNRAEQLADFVLQPCGNIIDRCRRPIYAVRDLEAFVHSVRRRHPSAGPGIPLQVCTIKIDAADPRGWKMRPPAPYMIPVRKT